MVTTRLPSDLSVVSYRLRRDLVFLVGLGAAECASRAFCLQHILKSRRIK